MVRVGLSGDDAVRLLGQLFPRQHSRRDHGNSLPFWSPAWVMVGGGGGGAVRVCSHPPRTPTTPDGAGAGPGGGRTDPGRGLVVGGTFRGGPGGDSWAALGSRCGRTAGRGGGGTAPPAQWELQVLLLRCSGRPPSLPSLCPLRTLMGTGSLWAVYPSGRAEAAGDT